MKLKNILTTICAISFVVTLQSMAQPNIYCPTSIKCKSGKCTVSENNGLANFFINADPSMDATYGFALAAIPNDGPLYCLYRYYENGVVYPAALIATNEYYKYKAIGPNWEVSGRPNGNNAKCPAGPMVTNAFTLPQTCAISEYSMQRNLLK